MNAIAAVQEVPEVREDDAQTRIDTMRAQAKELRNVLEHEGRISALEYALVESRKDAVSARIETNDALRDMADRIGQLSVTRWFLVIALSITSVALSAIAVVSVLQFVAGLR